MAASSNSTTSPAVTGRHHIPLNVGKVSSIGDVGTIRTQLQHRKDQLSKEIGVEQEITKGTKKLSKMKVLNKKTRDQASLEHDFSVSKIQLLRSELAKINSSLQAYQPESARSTQIPLIPLSLKTTNRISFISPLSDVVEKHYYVDPILVQDAICDFQELRYSISSVPKDDSGIKTLFEYLGHLSLLSKRFINSKIQHGISFIWHDAINGTPATQQSYVFEKACVIFNIAALYTQIGAQQDRSTKENIQTAISYLEKALGIIEYMKHNFSHSPTLDMTPQVLSFFSDLMRAQAVELQWDLLVLEGLKETDIQSLVEYSQRTKTIAECFRPLRELVEEPPFKEYIPPAWAAIVKIKDAHYKAIAHYYAAVIHEKMYEICSKGLNDRDIEAHRASITTELHFLYTADSTNIDELFSPDDKHQMGLAKSHLNCATVLHDYALNFKSLSKELESITILKKLLEDASTRTQRMKDKVSNTESIAMISPTIQPAIIDLNPVIPSFTKVKDTFEAIGPLQKFCAEYSWSPPKKLTLSKRTTGGYGFSVRGSKPVRISSVRDDDDRGLAVDDWIIKVNDKDVRWLMHADVVSLVQSSPNDILEIEVITPTASATPTAKGVGKTPTSKEPPTSI
ncbi:PREDICTED: rhophilin-2-like isoform X2 [Amphimedon queenslandica]|uniref:Uncharacterized protein n=1 Tax=Amphimedon queenslandica TaxID=400682 RepID=A0AAN0J1T8_AMPQE|nr:PREDICTED: rhophilin-2-like isoform X2 [Amphimedon queenslandica]|eukprot:XP_019850691.1 PREDICTED: rhophilin-2-like isoform X2 [Amphimedon queenslandica]